MYYDSKILIYKLIRVVEEGEYIVVYRKRQLKYEQWGARDNPQTIFSKYIVEMTDLYSFIKNK